jgi:hypothetical protein
MTARRHTREELDGFLDREFRQVWALHRSSGDRLFIEPGMADLLRPVAKEHWRCPAQGCTDPISLRGKTKRDHLFHVSGSCTGGGAESMWHLQGKAMLAEWAERQPGYLTVLEEQTVKDPKTLLHRRADVMVTWPSGRALALEVEYKKAPPEQLIAKHDQYVDLGAGCTWLFGHTHLRLERRPDYLSAEAPWDLIKWTSQLRAMAARGVPLLFVNPVTRQVGTAHIAGQHELDDVLKSRRAWWEDLRFVGDRLPDAADEFGVLKLEVDDLDCCTIDPEVGLVTPTLQRIREGRAAIEAAAAPARARWEAERARREAQEAAAERRREAQAAKDQDRQARAEARSPQERKAFAKERTERDAAAWKADPLRERTLAEFDGRLPRFLADRGREDWGVHGNPEAWHSHLFEQIVLGGPERSNRVGREFKVPQAYAIVGRTLPAASRAALPLRSDLLLSVAARRHRLPALRHLAERHDRQHHRPDEPDRAAASRVHATETKQGAGSRARGPRQASGGSARATARPDPHPPAGASAGAGTAQRPRLPALRLRPEVQPARELLRRPTRGVPSSRHKCNPGHWSRFGPDYE